jgi:hypothetical protein
VRESIIHLQDNDSSCIAPGWYFEDAQSRWIGPFGSEGEALDEESAYYAIVEESE